MIFLVDEVITLVVDEVITLVEVKGKIEQSRPRIFSNGLDNNLLEKKIRLTNSR